MRLLPLALSGLFKYEIYPRASLHGENYVTSTSYRGSRTRDNQWIVFQHHVKWCAVAVHAIAGRLPREADRKKQYKAGPACRSDQETKTCVGRVEYFVKAEPRSEVCKQAVAALGLPTEPQRFAIVEAFVAEDVQKSLSKLTLKTPWVKEVANALVKARITEKPTDFLGLLSAIQASCPVLAIGDSSRVKLRLPSAEAGSLARLAIPISSNCQAWYNKDANWGVLPLCRIDPRKSTVNMDVDAGRMQGAVNRLGKTKLYFVYTWSKSNSQL
jgi:hypothetical protein